MYGFYGEYPPLPSVEPHVDPVIGGALTDCSQPRCADVHPDDPGMFPARCARTKGHDGAHAAGDTTTRKVTEVWAA